MELHIKSGQQIIHIWARQPGLKHVCDWICLITYLADRRFYDRLLSMYACLYGWTHDLHQQTGESVYCWSCDASTQHSTFITGLIESFHSSHYFTLYSLGWITCQVGTTETFMSYITSARNIESSSLTATNSLYNAVLSNHNASWPTKEKYTPWILECATTTNGADFFWISNTKALVILSLKTKKSNTVT